jgi:hypothetical protein
MWSGNPDVFGPELRDQATRIEGAKRAELLAQAVAALRSCLEIYTPEAFPMDHKQAQEQLNECEQLLAKVQAKQP